MAKSKGLGCGTIILVLIAVGVIGSAFSSNDSEEVAATATKSAVKTTKPKATTQSAPSNSVACTKARNANSDFVDVMNALDAGELDNSSAAEEIGIIEDALDETRKTISDSSFQSAMLGHANIVGLARMSLENNDIGSYDFAVKEFITNGGYFRPYCG